MRTRPFLTALVATAAVAVSSAIAWDAPGHRAITLLALDRLDAGAPAFLREEATRLRIASQACEPDRWRASGLHALTHVNNPDHYIDIEPMEEAGLRLAEMPALRYEYLAALALLREKDPSKFDAPDPVKDPAMTRTWPGFLPYAIAESYARLQVSMKTMRMMEALGDPSRAEQAAQARANVVYHMGILSHFVGDAAQPLHTTRHHHGWVGENPKDYTRRYSFHAEIDGAVLERHGLGYGSLRALPLPACSIDPQQPFEGARDHIKRAFDLVEPLYALDKDGGLLKDEGKAMITERLLDGAATLAAFYNAAWESSAPTDAEIQTFVKYDKWEAAGQGIDR